MENKYIYLITDNNFNYKIGVSSDVEKRLKSLQTGNPEILELEGYVEVPPDEAFKIEKEIFKHLDNYRVKNKEWFTIKPNIDMSNYRNESVKQVRDIISCILMEMITFIIKYSDGVDPCDFSYELYNMYDTVKFFYRDYRESEYPDVMNLLKLEETDNNNLDIIIEIYYRYLITESTYNKLLNLKEDKNTEDSYSLLMGKLLKEMCGFLPLLCFWSMSDLSCYTQCSKDSGYHYFDFLNFIKNDTDISEISV